MAQHSEQATEFGNSIHSSRCHTKMCRTVRRRQSTRRMTSSNAHPPTRTRSSAKSALDTPQMSVRAREAGMERETDADSASERGIAREVGSSIRSQFRSRRLRKTLHLPHTPRGLGSSGHQERHRTRRLMHPTRLNTLLGSAQVSARQSVRLSGSMKELRSALALEAASAQYSSRRGSRTTRSSCHSSRLTVRPRRHHRRGQWQILIARNQLR